MTTDRLREAVADEPCYICEGHGAVERIVQHMGHGSRVKCPECDGTGKAKPNDALREAVARLMGSGYEDEPWWLVHDNTWVTCLFCGGEWGDSAEDITHTDNCPAMQVEAAMRDDDDV